MAPRAAVLLLHCATKKCLSFETFWLISRVFLTLYPTLFFVFLYPVQFCWNLESCKKKYRNKKISHTLPSWIGESGSIFAAKSDAVDCFSLHLPIVHNFPFWWSSKDRNIPRFFLHFFSNVQWRKSDDSRTHFKVESNAVGCFHLSPLTSFKIFNAFHFAVAESVEFFSYNFFLWWFFFKEFQVPTKLNYVQHREEWTTASDSLVSLEKFKRKNFFSPFFLSFWF